MAEKNYKIIFNIPVFSHELLIEKSCRMLLELICNELLSFHYLQSYQLQVLFSVLKILDISHVIQIQLDTKEFFLLLI